MPLIKKRWPGYAGSLSRSISLQSDAAILLNDSAINDLNSIRCDNSSSLSIQKLHELSDINLRNLLRYWISDMGFALPSSQKLRQIIDTVLTAAEDRSPCVDWPGVEVRRYRDQLMVMSPQLKQDLSVTYQWDLKQALQLPAGLLSAKKITGQGFHIDTNLVDVRFRQGGETLKLAGHKHTIILKKYLQEQGIPPWLRDQIPLIYHDDQLIAVSDLCIVDRFVVNENVEGWTIGFDRDEGI